ncbi:hypothetical protein M569_07713, partial [Genlisea aurea]
MDSREGLDESLLRNYRLGKTLGNGSFGKVKLAEHMRTGHKVAIKILNKRKMKSRDMEEKVRREIKICQLFVHPHVIRIYEVVETPMDIYVVMEYVTRGELFDYIVEKGRLQEDEARQFFQQIVSGVNYCHRNMVVHRDLKPENLLLDSKCNIKIADFGLSNIMRDGHFLKTSCGSPNYASPEVVSGKLYAGPEVDVWSCGVILYALLCGTLPFDDENISNLFKKIKRGRYIVPRQLSPGALDLIQKMLDVDPVRRITTCQIRQHAWFKVNLPRYLAVIPANALEHLKRLDEEIIQVVLKLGFDRNQLIESLQNRIKNDATVTYYLLLDNQSAISVGSQGTDFPESTSRSRPQEIMAQILAVLQGLNVRWKKIGYYNLKCLYIHTTADMYLTAWNGSNSYLDGDVTSSAGNVPQAHHLVKFEIQLYKTGDAEHLLDIQRLSGPIFLFLDFCASFLKQLDV